ncbi:MAG: hypothetical protein KGV56_05065 [Gammaproteobacteria bacterium]|nr:hypothetical protein [Gammaproteobacteria bacterium]
MAYETGTANDIRNLLDKLKDHAIGHGWTSDWRGDVLFLQKNSHYFAIHCLDNRVDAVTTDTRDPYPKIELYCLTGDNGQSLSRSPGYAQNGGAQTNGLFPPFVQYEIYSGDTYLHVVIEINGGNFAHFGCGCHEKAFDYQGGSYVYGIAWSHRSYDRTSINGSYHRRLFAGNNGQLVYEGNVYPFNGYAGIGGNAFTASQSNGFVSPYLYNASPNTINGIAPLLPYISCIKPNGSEGMFILGRVPEMRAVKIDFLQPRETVTLGTEEWVVYPIKCKSLVPVTHPEFSSETHGIAYKKIP